MTTQRMGRAAAALVAVGLLAGCSGGGTQPVPVPVPPQVSAAPAPSNRPPEGSGPPTSSGGSANPQRCTAAELSVSVGAADPGAGSVVRPLVFTNTGSRTCELRGFPGVSYVAGADGHQVGPAAEMSGERGGEVPISPRGTAVAQLQLVNVQNFEAAVCMPTSVRGLRVYAPGETAAVFVPMDGTGCAGRPPGPQLTVRTVTAR
jgi:hypothetical protein